MKVLILVLAYAFLGAEALSISQQWTQFKSDYGVIYESLAEERHRYQIFQDNLKKIEEHNARSELGLETYYMAVNKFSDMTQKEFGQMMRGEGKGPKRTLHITAAPPARRVGNFVGDKTNWQDHGAVLSVEDQGDCEAGWAISAKGALESMNIINLGYSFNLSAQQLVDCTVPEGGSCADGDILTALKYAMTNGLTRQEDYPYTGVKGKCNATKQNFVKVNNIMVGLYTGDDLEAALDNHGPIAAYVDPEPLHQYGYGVLACDEDNCTRDANKTTHGVLIVGYGFDGQASGREYWIVRNSWGPHFGEVGYVRFGKCYRMCGMGLNAMYPDL